MIRIPTRVVWQWFFSLRTLRITFYTCLAAACILHACGLLFYGYGHDRDMAKVPFTVIRVKLGNSPTAGRVMTNDFSRFSAPSSGGSAPASLSKPPAPSKRPAIPNIPSLQRMPTPVARPFPSQGIIPAAPAPVASSLAPLAATPGSPAGQSIIRGSPLGNSAWAEEDTIRAYDVLLSLWFAQHKIYPKEAQRRKLEGRGILLITIDHQGRIREYQIARSTGHAILDRAILAMMEHANPVPPLPDSYPADRLYNARIPIGFSMPK